MFNSSTSGTQLPGCTCAWLLLFLLLKFRPVTGQLGIPGATATKSGYDTEMGTDPMCWRSPADQGPNATLSVPNPLVADFKLAGAVELLKECPKGNTLVATAPPEFIRGERLRTRRFYNYSVDIDLNLRTLGASYFVSDWGPRVAIQIVICSLGDSGFCSPFIHEETNERLFKLGLPLSPAPGDRHGGTHVHSPYRFVDLHPDDGPRYKITLQVPMLVNQPGTYFAVAAIQMMVAKSEFVPVEIRYDMANAMVQNEQRIVTYQDPATILEVPGGVKAASYIAIGISGSILFYLLAETIRNRAHQVIRLTQGVFLILFLTMALIATVASFLFEPKNDLYCQASYPILLICLQFMYATTLGRLWRINSMISPMLVRTMASRHVTKNNSARNCIEQAGNKLMEFTRQVAFFGSTRKGAGPHSPRMMITDWHLSRVILFFTLPQVIMQILSVTFQPRRRVIEFNADESIGRATCHSAVPPGVSILYYSCLMFLILVMMLLTMAAGTRKLPSLFNETQDILDSAISSLVLLVLGVAIILVTNEPTVSPGVQYLVWVVMALSLCLNFSLRIMTPKLNMVWNGEVVLVSKLVSDHNRNLQDSEQQQRDGRTTTVFVSGLESENGSRVGAVSQFSASSAENVLHLHSRVSDVSDHDLEDNHVHHLHKKICSNIVSSLESEDAVDVTQLNNGHSCPDDPGAAQAVTSCEEMERALPDQEVGLMQIPESVAVHETSPRGRTEKRKACRRRSSKSKILISKEVAPERRLVLKMVDLQEQLAGINGRIMSGLVVDEQDWEATRSLVKRLGETFHEEVRFSWEAPAPSPVPELPLQNHQSSDDDASA